MFAGFSRDGVMDDHDWEPHTERRSLSLPVTRRVDGTTVHLDDVPHNRQPEPQSRGVARQSSLRLSKPFEHVRQEVRTNTDTGVADDDIDVRIHAFDPDLDASLLWRELHRIRQKIPDDLLQSIRITRDRTDMRIDDRLDPDTLRVGSRLHRGHGVVHR